MVSEYECRCDDCLDHRPRNARYKRIKNQSKMKEFEGWRAAVKNFYNNKCALCNSIKGLQIDHIIPLSLGGDHAMYNMQVLCKSCNFNKLNKNSNDYRKYPKLIAIIIS